MLTASHRPPYGRGDFHPHTWEIIAHFRGWQNDAETLQYVLNEYVAQYAGKLLPDRLSRGEALAADIWRYMSSEIAPCARVDIARHAERLYASWPA